MPRSLRLSSVVLLAVLVGCGINPGLRADRDNTIGVLETAGYTLRATDGVLHVVGSTDNSVLLRASCLEVELTLTRRTSAQVEVQITNIPADFALVGPPGALTVDGSPIVGTPVADIPLTARWALMFGAHDSVVSGTPERAQIGRYGYVPPEVLAGSPADERSDVWALARVLAWAAGDRSEVLAALGTALGEKPAARPAARAFSTWHHLLGADRKSVV